MLINNKLILSWMAIVIISCHEGNSKSAITSQKDLESNFLSEFFKNANERENSVGTVARDQVKFLLYHPTRDNPTELNPSSSSRLLDDVILIIHGWEGNGRLRWIKDMAQKYYSIYQNVYVIAVDWSVPAGKTYISASNSVQSVGFITAQLLWTFIEENPDRLNDVHLIGHSLGAQAAGFVGQKIQILAGKKIDRITGLDPAAPLFTVPLVKKIWFRLTEDDAEFVDIYHTSVLLEGQTIPSGHVDVYWNCGGPIQPGCEDDLHLLKAASCSHQLAHQYFANTIENGKIYPVEICNSFISGRSIVDSGEFIDRRASGRYCGSTGHQSDLKCSIFLSIIH